MDPSRPAVVGTVVWSVALVVLLVVRDELPDDQRWWLWTAVVGVALGLVGSAVSLRRRSRLRRQVLVELVPSPPSDGSSTTTATSGDGADPTGSAGSTRSATSTTSTTEP